MEQLCCEPLLLVALVLQQLPLLLQQQLRTLITLGLLGELLLSLLLLKLGKVLQQLRRVQGTASEPLLHAVILVLQACNLLLHVWWCSSLLGVHLPLQVSHLHTQLGHLLCEVARTRCVALTCLYKLTCKPHGECCKLLQRPLLVHLGSHHAGLGVDGHDEEQKE